MAPLLGRLCVLGSNGFGFGKSTKNKSIVPWAYATSGGSISNIPVGTDTYRLHQFTSSGSIVFSSAGKVEILLVAGGNGGAAPPSAPRGGPGGNGGQVLETLIEVNASPYPVTVGPAGTYPGGAGGNSSLSTVASATGGGGGPGGGGGNFVDGPDYVAGRPGNGGTITSFTGTSIGFGGGGGGGGSAPPPSSGGTGVNGGAPGAPSGGSAGSATANRGGGGGGGRYNGGGGGSPGSNGFVAIRYKVLI